MPVDILSFRCIHRHTAESHPKCYQKYLKENKLEESTETGKVEYGKGYVNIVCSSERLISLDDILRQYKISQNEWEVEKYIVKTTEGYRKDRQVEWDVDDGVVTHGKVRDSGKMLIVILYHHEVRLTRKTEEIRANMVINDLTVKAQSFSPKYQKINYNVHDENYLYEIALPDLQLGRLVLEEETNSSNSVDLAVENAKNALYKLIGYTKDLPINRILFPIGNDFFDSNTAEGTTVHGTPQRDDVRWQRTFNLAQKLIVDVTDKLSVIAPVDLVVVGGNHDEERIFYFGKTLDAWYHNNPNVKVDCEPKLRKYYQHEKNLIGLTHGYYEKNEILANLMAYEKPEMWASSKNREWHLGDKHHKKDVIFKTDELINGVVVRILRSLALPSVWEYNKGFVGSLKAAEAFVWHPENGVIMQFTAVP